VARSLAAADGIRSDEFNSAVLDTSVWTFVDPIGDSTLTMTGSQARIALPAGSRHDLWANANEVSRLRQSAPNADFEVEVKFDSSVAAGYQLQGVVVEQDAQNLLRLEVFHDGDGTHLFAAAIAGGSASVQHYSDVAGGAPTYLRVKRTGNFWTLSHSRNGTSWTSATFSYPLTVASLGPYAGNSGASPPAFAGQIDYFREITPVVDPDPPVITAVSAAPSATAALITWTTNEAADSRVAYGPTSAYENGSVSESPRITSHGMTLSGLNCSTEYHYRVSSQDAAGNEGASSDRTFTTASCPTAIQSDEFTASTLDTSVWTFVDPLGDSELALTGSQAALSVPAGTRHDLWTGANEVPRLLQAAPNSDFEVEAKWDTAVQEPYELQGLLVVQDADDLLRIETHHDGAATRLFVARIAAGSASMLHFSTVADGAPVYFRLEREGDDWTLRTSADGSSWTLRASFTSALTVREIGPFAGNSGNAPPDFTSRIDYFRDIPPDLTPPAISAVNANSTGAAATISWTTDETATSEVRYGTTMEYAAGTVTKSGSVTSHSIVLHGLACESLYHFQVRSRDLAGNEAVSTNQTFSSGACPSVIASDEFDAPALDSGVWTLVDPMGDATLALTGSHAELSVPAGVRHDLWTNVDEVPRLLQAAPDDDFELEVKYDSAVAAGYQMQGVLVEQDTNDLLRIETHHDGGTAWLFVASVANGVASTIDSRVIPASASLHLRVARVGDKWTVRYSPDGDAWPVGASFTRDMTVTAVGPFAGNSGNSPPAFKARIDYFREITDRTSPVLSDIVVSPRQTSAIVSWTTDEKATSHVDHGITTAYGQTTADSKLTTRHWARVPNLACATSYHLQVHSSDELGNGQTSTDRQFTTGACGGTGGPEIDVWGGDTLRFGAVGIPQQWVNVVGNAYDAQGVTSLRATLNGTNSQNLTLGPDGGRLERAGDFNLELNRSLLLPGPNQVVITAVDGAGHESTRTITVDWQGHSAGSPPPPTGPVLVIAAHGDDALLGMAGIIRRERMAGRQVYVAAVTNGDPAMTGELSGYCGAPDGDAATTTFRGLTLAHETMSAVGLLGLGYSTNLAETDVFLLGYPNDGLVPISQSAGSPWPGGGSRLRHTYGEDFDGSNATCNGDLRYLLDGRHSVFTAAELAADFDSLLQLTQPSDIYTLVDFDGHPDHAEVARQTVASVRRLDVSVRVHGTLVHPHESDNCMGFSAEYWPNPALENNDPFARFTPWLEFTAPPIPTCGSPVGASWGPLGPPTEWIEVPAEMQAPTEAANLKWQTLNVWDSQCPPDDPLHVTCGYFRAFVKNSEFFWTRTYTGQRDWPDTYAANWSSTGSIPELVQVVDGQWTYDPATAGIRPLAPGYDRLLVLGQFDWRSYEATVPLTVHWFDQTRGSAGVGVGLGWQGHTSYGGMQPRLGHPYGGICSFGRSGPEPALPRLEMVQNTGDVEDGVVGAENPPRAITFGVPYTMKFRRTDLGTGAARYRCKLWKSSAPEPAGWDLTVDLPDRPGTTGPFPGSALLLAHNADATFGDVQIVPLAGA